MVYKAEVKQLTRTKTCRDALGEVNSQNARREIHPWGTEEGAGHDGQVDSMITT